MLSLADAYKYNYQRSNLIVPPGHLVVIQSGEPHSSWSNDRTGQALRLMFFDPDILQRVATEVVGSVEVPVFPHLVVTDPHVIELFLQFM